MVGRGSCLLWIGWIGWAGASLVAGERPTPGEAERGMTASIDEHLARAWAGAGVEPAARSGDAEFLRRASLDLAGKIPTVGEARDFLDDPAPEKRRALTARLLRGPAAANHFVNTWRPLLAPAGGNPNLRVLAPDFDRWLRDRFVEQPGFDQVVRELLTHPVDSPNPQAQPRGNPSASPSPLAFYAAREYKPEELASATARVLLGVRIECAQCHDHPFATWRRDQFWELAASFGGIKRQVSRNARNPPINETRGRAELEIPGTGRKVGPRFLDGTEPKGDENGREALAAWVTAAGNPYFARATVNRAWAQLFGVGIVDPVDDFSAGNPPSHPELLDDLARRFAGSGYNLPLLLRAIAASRAYQLTSAGPPERSDDPRLFARMAVKAMSGEQWWDSLDRALGLPPEFVRNNRLVLAPATPRAALMEKFAAGDDHAVDRPTSILQAMTLMHGPIVAQGTDPKRGATLGAILDTPFLDNAGRIEVLYLAALARPPRPEERARMTAYVEAREPKAALADVLWALVNGAEFALNH